MSYKGIFEFNNFSTVILSSSIKNKHENNINNDKDNNNSKNNHYERDDVINNSNGGRGRGFDRIMGDLCQRINKNISLYQIHKIARYPEFQDTTFQNPFQFFWKIKRTSFPRGNRVK